MPFAGPVDQVMDRVGLSKITYIAYAPHNDEATYDFNGQDSNLVFGTVPFRGFLDLGHARPYVLDGSLIPELQTSLSIVAFRRLPGMEPPDGPCSLSSGYACIWVGPDPIGGGSGVVPIVDPFN